MNSEACKILFPISGGEDFSLGLAGSDKRLRDFRHQTSEIRYLMSKVSKSISFSRLLVA